MHNNFFNFLNRRSRSTLVLGSGTLSIMTFCSQIFLGLLKLLPSVIKQLYSVIYVFVLYSGTLRLLLFQFSVKVHVMGNPIIYVFIRVKIALALLHSRRRHRRTVSDEDYVWIIPHESSNHFISCQPLSTCDRKEFLKF